MIIANKTEAKMGLHTTHLNQELRHTLFNSSPEKIYEFIKIELLKTQNTAGWCGRALFLLDAILPALCGLRDRQGLELSVDYLKANLELKDVELLYNMQTVTLEEKQKISSYWNFLPGYPLEDRREVSKENHDYLAMIIIGCITSEEFLKLVQKHDTTALKFDLERSIDKTIARKNGKNYDNKI